MLEDKFDEFFSLNIDDYIIQDLLAWKKRLRKESFEDEGALKLFFCSRQEFRSIISYRIKILGDKKIAEVFKKLFSNNKNAFVQNLYIPCKAIAPGLYIEHGYASILNASKIGENFHVNQCVTIGVSKGKRPSIGDNVSIYANSVVIGGISIGNNSDIAAGSIVVTDVPENVVVASPKATIIKYK